MSDMRELYQQVIIDHGRKPRNFGHLENSSHISQGFNPLCGDEVTVYIVLNNNCIDKMCFSGCGCAISIASASLMTQQLKGKSLDEVEHLFEAFHQVVTGDNHQIEALGKLAVLSGVAEYPSRVKCATLCWHTMKAALQGSEANVTTE